MSRLQQPKRAEVDPAELEAYDSVITRLSGMADVTVAEGDDYDVGDYWGPLLSSPPLCALSARMGTFVRTAGERGNSYTHAQREFVDQILSKDWTTNVVQKMHIPDGIAAGVRLEAIEAIRYGHEENLNDEEQLLARYIRQTVSGTIDDATWSEMVELMGKRGVVEYTAFVLWLQWIIRMMQALGTTDPPEEEIDELIARLKSGEESAPDFMQRIR